MCSAQVWPPLSRRTKNASDLVIEWPRKRQELINAHVDSTVWNRFEFRDDDIVIASWGKSGCTWLQQIVGRLVFERADDFSVGLDSPWMEFACSPQEETLALLESQAHRRIIKTHLPVHSLVYSPKCRYLYIARDGRDVVWSLFNHFRMLNNAWYALMQKTRGKFGPLPTHPPTDFREFFTRWLLEDGYPFWPFWDNVQSWWEIRGLPNLMVLHFAELKNDLSGSIRRIGQFIGIEAVGESFLRIVEHSSLSYMKNNASSLIRGGDLLFRNGAKTFFSGGGGSEGWRGNLNDEDLLRYKDAETHSLPFDCANWLRSGKSE